MIRDDLWRSEFEKLKALDEPPGIVTLYDQGETKDGLPYVAMRLITTRKVATCLGTWLIPVFGKQSGSS